MTTSVRVFAKAPVTQGSRPGLPHVALLARRRPALLWLSCLAAGLFTACSPSAPEKRPLVAFEGETMGTYYRIQVAGEEMGEERQEAVHEAAVQAMEAVNVAMSTYIEDSEISRFNRHLETVPFEVSSTTFEVLQAAMDVSEAAGGAFDVTVGPLVDAWGFGPDMSPPRWLEEEELEELLERIGYDKLTLDEASSTVGKSYGDLHTDLSGIAKGYAVDLVSESLAALGITDSWVEIGGEVRASGANAFGTPWRLGIERPEIVPGLVQRIVRLTDLAVATSGDYRNYREVDGQRYSHIIDPRDGRPIRHHLASVSVFHRQCVVADGWATALMVLGEKEGFALAEAEGLAALFLVRDGEEVNERGTAAFWALGESSGAESG